MARVLALGASSIACSIAGGIAAFASLHWSLPPTDSAYDQTLMETWSDPAVRYIALLLMWIGAGLGFALSCWLLWRTQLAKSIPIVFSVTVLVAALTGPLGPLGIPLSIAAGAGSMIWCRYRFAAPRSGPAVSAP